jgi:pilus assembly protein CpaF
MHDQETQKIYEKSLRHFLAPIMPLLDDKENVSEVVVNGPDEIYCERNGKMQKQDCRFEDSESLLAAARNLAEYVNRTLDENHHSMDARMPNGNRVHVIIPPAARNGVCFSIRIFKKSSFSLERLIEWGSMTAEVAEFLRLCVIMHKNTIISGGTGTGKTSTLNALSSAIPDHERIIVIEDTSELQLEQPHTVYLEAQPAQPDGRGQVTIRDLFVDSLRMRPDRIVVGEVRRGEALDLIQSMISGHSGSLSTVHADTPRAAAIRLETLSLMSDVSLPVYVARTQVALALDLIVQIARLGDGSRRVMKVTEVLGLDERGEDGSQTYKMTDIYQFKSRGRDAEGKILGELVRTGNRPSFAAEPGELGIEHLVNLTRTLFAADEQTPAN